MSGILGVWNLDGRPVSRPLLARLSATLKHRGADGEGSWIEGSVGFACQNFWVTPESVKEIQPIIDRSGVAVLFDGRLDNREELFRHLNDAEEMPADASDALLIARTYSVVGESILERLVGDFALAVFNPVMQRLVLVRDTLGIRPLYYARVGQTFLFASEIKTILAHPEVATRPNDDHIADFLFDRIRESDVTFFSNIYNLPPAHLLAVSQTQLTKRRYWDFDPGYRIRYATHEDYVKALQELFQQAVRRRLRSAYPLAVSVSGGVDSSAIICTAETLVRRGQASSPDLFGVSYLTTEGTPSDEQIFLTEIERAYGTTIDRIPPGPMKILEGSRKVVWCLEAPFLDEQWGNSERTLCAVRNRGARVMLTGHWGDQFMFSQAYLIDLARRFRWRTVARHLRQYCSWLRDVDPKLFYYRLFVGLVMTFAPSTLVPMLRRLRRRKISPWYTTRFRRHSLQRLMGRPMRTTQFPSAYANSLYETANAGYYVFCMEWNNKLAAAYGLEMTFPFLDRDLIRFMLAIPGEVHAPEGVPKGLFRDAMREVVPAPILGRTWKADFTHLVNEGVDQEFAHVIDCLEEKALAVKMGYVHGARLREVLAPLRERLQRPDCVAAWHLTDLLGLELWLQTFFGNEQSGGSTSVKTGMAT